MSYSKTNQFSGVTVPSEEIKKQLSNYTLLTFKAHQKAVQKLVNASKNKSLTPEDSPTYKCSGQLSVAYTGFHDQLTLESLNFDDFPGSYTYSGDGFSISAGSGGSVGWYKGWFSLTPTQLVNTGDIGYTFQSIPAGTRVLFYADSNILGVIIATGITVGSNMFTGAGTFAG